jgi:uncharacterized repeat protein (TIGR02543 family)
MKKKAFISCVWLAAFALAVAACGGGTTTGETTYTVTFNSMGGPTVPIQTVEPGGTVKEPSWIEKEGYVFDGNWYREFEEPYGERWIFDGDLLSEPDTVDENITLYARWLEDKQIIISFYYSEAAYSGGTPDVSVEQQVGDYLALNERNPPDRTGYVFQYWYYAADDVLKNRVAGITVTENEYHLIALWLEAVTVTFNTNGGSPVNPEIVSKGGTIYLEDYTTRRQTEGQNDLFDGWYIDAAFTTLASAQQTVDDNMTLYARFYSLADLQRFTGVWKHQSGKTYLINIDLTAWYFDDTTYEICAMRWRPMILGSRSFTLNADGDTLTLDGTAYTKATVPKEPEGNPELSVRWVHSDAVNEISLEFTLETDGTGNLIFSDSSVTSSFRGEIEICYATDDDYVYLLDKDGHVLLAIEYVIREAPNPVITEKTTRWLGGFFWEQELLTPGIE